MSTISIKIRLNNLELRLRNKPDRLYIIYKEKGMTDQDVEAERQKIIKEHPGKDIHLLIIDSAGEDDKNAK